MNRRAGIVLSLTLTEEASLAGEEQEEATAAETAGVSVAVGWVEAEEVEATMAEAAEPEAEMEVKAEGLAAMVELEVEVALEVWEAA